MSVDMLRISKNTFAEGIIFTESSLSFKRVVPKFVLKSENRSHPVRKSSYLFKNY